MCPTLPCAPPCHVPHPAMCPTLPCAIPCHVPYSLSCACPVPCVLPFSCKCPPFLTTAPLPHLPPPRPPPRSTSCFVRDKACGVNAKLPPSWSPFGWVVVLCAVLKKDVRTDGVIAAAVSSALASEPGGGSEPRHRGDGRWRGGHGGRWVNYRMGEGGAHGHGRRGEGGDPWLRTEGGRCVRMCENVPGEGARMLTPWCFTIAGLIAIAG